MTNRKFSVGLFGAALVAVLVSLPKAAAQQHQSRSFMNVSAIYATNTWNPTNLLTAGSRGTNVPGFHFTNLHQLQVIIDSGAVSNLNNSRINPFKDVVLWALRDGSPSWNLGLTNGAEGLNVHQSFATLNIKWIGGSGANTAIPFVFTPVYNGVDEATAAGQEWTLTLAAPGTTTATVQTNVPLHKWPGAAKLRLRRVVNADTDASSAVIITDISLNGFPP